MEMLRNASTSKGTSATTVVRFKCEFLAFPANERYDCNGTGAQKWLINNGRTKVKLEGTNYCLDAGSHPGNRIGMNVSALSARLTIDLVVL
jgi:hypothetical protein